MSATRQSLLKTLLTVAKIENGGMRLHNSKSRFLNEYWQCQPLLIKQAIPNFKNPVSPDQLMKLSSNPRIISQVISKKNNLWESKNGPFSENHFDRDDTWTLLLHNLDYWNRDIDCLRTEITFLPRWRFDNIMASYAVDGAGVGPHFDNYDVFLLQGYGKKEWLIGQFCDEMTPKLIHDKLDLIADFKLERTFHLEPGDVLYLPPKLAHWGIALGESITYSLGFRAPSVGDLLARQTDAVLEGLSNGLLLEDNFTVHSGRPGEITTTHINNARRVIKKAINKHDDGSWFGELVTEPRGTATGRKMQLFSDSDSLRLSSEVRIAWIARPDHIDVFLDGERFSTPNSCVSVLIDICDDRAVKMSLIRKLGEPLFEYLIESGSLIVGTSH